MILIFNIDYRTAPGESLAVDIQSPHCPLLEMKPTGAHMWHADINLPASEKVVKYRYVVLRDGKIAREEWGSPHSLHTDGGPLFFDLYDRWQDMPADKPFYSQAFTNCINRRTDTAKPLSPHTGYLFFSAGIPTVAPDETVVMTGSCDALGNWDVTRAPEMNDARFPLWQMELDLKTLPTDLEYKMVIVRKADRSVIKWEEGDNRYLSTRGFRSSHAVVESGLLFNHKQPIWRGAGVAIPLFSLKSEEDCGVGDFYDLMKLVDWAVATGQKFIQILPVNDTTMTGTWTDSYPYNANSTFALHPMYMRLEAMGQLDDQSRREHYKTIATELNKLKSIDYERVTKAKTTYMHELFEQDGKKVTASDGFRQFYESNKSWLKPYAAFCVLRDIYGTPQFEYWEQYSRYDSDTIDKFIKSHSHEIDFVYFQQYHLDRQLRHVSRYAKIHGIAIKGDIPIGISRTSVDAWTSPRLFNLDSQAGAPPDDFSVIGQNWGFPTYNWSEMSRDGFAWWKSRFAKMAEYFDAYRIDHVLGFFRIWEIPMNAVHGLLGYFNASLPMSPGEMTRDYDFKIDTDLHTRPFIMDSMLHDLFGEYTDEARATFLENIGGGRYRLRTPYSTQRQVTELFANLEKNEKNTRLYNALMSLLDEVLFIEDPRQPGMYHPRISGQNTRVYNTLSDYQRWCFDRLHDDYFYRRQDDFWKREAMWKLPPLIDATGMLACAEDLGMIPDCVPAVIHNLKILSLEIQRMPKTYGVRFDNPANYPYYSVCTTSTHDTSGIRGWWEEDRETSKAYFRDMLHDSGEAPYFAEPWLCERIVKMHLQSPAILCILPLQDWLSVDGKIRRDNPIEERINVPADSRHYWRYRMHISLEELLHDDEFNNRILSMIKESGRN